MGKSTNREEPASYGVPETKKKEKNDTAKGGLNFSKNQDQPGKVLSGGRESSSWGGDEGLTLLGLQCAGKTVVSQNHVVHWEARQRGSSVKG